MLEKPYVDAGKAAQLLGVSRQTVVSDVERGMNGDVKALFGQARDGMCIVRDWELKSPRLEMHQKRLSTASVNTVTP
jgi:hypothetical protein